MQGDKYMTIKMGKELKAELSCMFLFSTIVCLNLQMGAPDVPHTFNIAR